MRSPFSNAAGRLVLWVLLSQLAACAFAPPSIPPAKPVLRVPAAADDASAQIAVEAARGQFPEWTLTLDAAAGNDIAVLAKSLCEPHAGLGEVGARQALQTKTVKTVYVLAAPSAAERDAAETFARSMKEARVRVALASVMQADESDFSPILNRAAVDQPQLLFVAAPASLAARLLAQLDQRRLKVPTLLADTQGQGVALPGALTLTTAAPPALRPGAGEFLAAFRARSARNADAADACRFDATRAWLLAAAAAREAGAKAVPPPSAVTSKLKEVSFVGVTGPIGFDAKGERRVLSYALLRAVGTGAEWVGEQRYTRPQ